MTDIAMLPLPELPEKESDERGEEWIEPQIEAYATAYARAVAEHNVKALQAELDNRWATGVHTCHDKCQRIACVLRRENEALRAEVERQKQWLSFWGSFASLQSKLAEQAETRAERLEEALRGLEVCANTAVRCYSHRPGNFAVALKELRHSAERARAALRDHDQEGSDG